MVCPPVSPCLMHQIDIVDDDLRLEGGVTKTDVAAGMVKLALIVVPAKACAICGPGNVGVPPTNGNWRAGRPRSRGWPERRSRPSSCRIGRARAMPIEAAWSSILAFRKQPGPSTSSNIARARTSSCSIPMLLQLSRTRKRSTKHCGLCPHLPSRHRVSPQARTESRTERGRDPEHPTALP